MKMYRGLLGYLSLRLISASPGLARWLEATNLRLARWLPGHEPLTSFSGTLPDAAARDLIVFLPGLADAASDFIEHEFLAVLRQRRLAVDIIAVDAHYGYYLKRTIVERLNEDILMPARARYARIWLVGISLGGVGALRVAQMDAEAAAGLVLLAPFLGDAPIRDSILRAGGLVRWQPGGDDVPEYQQELWMWLKAYLNAPDTRPPLYLGYGLQDSFAPINALLAALLPPERVVTCAGNHDWSTWRTLWPRLVDTLPLPVLEAQ